MARSGAKSWRRSVLRLVGAGLGLGIVIGLLLGWLVWPVTWYDTDPSDLRVAHQTSWVLMTADSLAITGDLETARGRVYELLDDDTTSEQVADLVASIAEERQAAGDPAGALRLQRLAQAVGMPSSGEAEFEPPKRRIAVTNRLTGYLVIVGAAIVAAALLVRFLAARVRAQVAHVRWGTAPRVPDARRDMPPRDGEASPSLQEPSRAADEPAGQIPDDPIASPARAVAAQGTVTRQFAWSESRTLPDQEEPPHRDEDRPADFVPMPMIANARPSTPAETPDEALGEFEARYHLGDDEFDASFTITSPEGEFLGECGVGISDVLSSEGVQRVDAFEVWLFDRAEIRTVSKFLVSEYASQDEAIHDQLVEKGDLVVPRDGLTFLVETLSLGLSVTVADAAYGDDFQRPHSHFSRLSVRMVVKSIDSPVV